MKRLVRDRPQVLQNGMQCIQQYIERNTTFEIQKASALSVFAGAVLSGHGILEACDLASVCTVFAARTIRRWAYEMFGDFFSVVSNIDDITDEVLEMELQSARGRHPKRHSMMSDDVFRKQVKQYVLEHGYVKGRPNLTLQHLVEWVKESYGVEVCTSTVSLWLHDIGFSYKQFSKGVYFDGHEREDVVEERKAYLAKLASYNGRMWTSHSPAPNPLCRPVIKLFHDESTFYANADQSFFWTDGSKQCLKQKSLGQAIMVSDFLDEVGGLLEYGGEKARLLLEHQTDGYFNNEMLLTQVEKVITIFEAKYPVAQGLFIFDHAPSHMKKPDDSLNAEHMNVKDGGKQPFMKDTEWMGEVQRMVTAQGIQKGMRTVLEEREVDTIGMNAKKMRELLGQYEVNSHMHTVYIKISCGCYKQPI